jgi:hypothetical protein
MKISKEDRKIALQAFLTDSELKYSLENCFENSTYNPNGYSVQQDYNREMKSKDLVRTKANEMRDDLAVAIDKCRGDFDEISNQRVQVLSEAVRIQDENLDKLEMRLEFYAELKKQRPDLELKLKTAVEIAQDLQSYLKKKAVTDTGSQKAAVLKRETVKKLEAQCSHR